MLTLFNKIPQLLMKPDTVETSSKIPGTAGSKEETLEFLLDDDNEKPIDLSEQKDTKEELGTKGDKKDDDKKEEVKEEEKEDELKLIEDELEEPTEEQLELVTPVRRQEILKKYPTIFKDFPYLEKAYYREQQFTKLLPTIQDAQEAVEKSQTLDKFEADLGEGKFEPIFVSVKNESPEAYYKMLDDLLPTLNRVDSQSYNVLIANVAKHIIREMSNEGQSRENDTLKNAAVILNQFLFNSSTWTPPVKFSKGEVNTEVTQEKDKISQERQSLVQERFESARDGVNESLTKVLKTTIEANIDPKDSMTPYIKRNASREVFETLTNAIDKDTRFKTLLDKLWENALKNNFSREYTDRIRTAYIAKAKTLLPTVLKSARNEALKGMGKRVVEDKIDDDEKDDGKPSRETRESASPQIRRRSGKITNPKDIPEGMRSIDFLNDDSM